MATATVIVQEWEESEAGWGVRPDGWTIHKNMEDCKQYSKEFWDRQTKILGVEVPPEYTRASGEPFEMEIDSGDELYCKLLESGKNGIRGKGNTCPVKNKNVYSPKEVQ